MGRRKILFYFPRIMSYLTLPHPLLFLYALLNMPEGMPAATGILKTKNTMSWKGDNAAADHIEDTTNQRASKKEPTATLWNNNDP